MIHYTLPKNVVIVSIYSLFFSSPSLHIPFYLYCFYVVGESVTCVNKVGTALTMLADEKEDFDIILLDRGLREVYMITFLRLTKDMDILKMGNVSTLLIYTCILFCFYVCTKIICVTNLSNGGTRGR